MSAGDVFGIHAPFWEIVYRSAIVYGAIVAGMRVTGRRQLGQMTPVRTRHRVRAVRPGGN